MRLDLNEVFMFGLTLVCIVSTAAGLYLIWLALFSSRNQ
jgi:hypothetical protein